MRTLVTGSTGFVGAGLIRHLLVDPAQHVVAAFRASPPPDGERLSSRQRVGQGASHHPQLYRLRATARVAQPLKAVMPKETLELLQSEPVKKRVQLIGELSMPEFPEHYPRWAEMVADQFILCPRAQRKLGCPSRRALGAHQSQPLMASFVQSKVLSRCQEFLARPA